jgi:hypothetical protein
MDAQYQVFKFPLNYTYDLATYDMSGFGPAFAPHGGSVIPSNTALSRWWCKKLLPLSLIIQSLSSFLPLSICPYCCSCNILTLSYLFSVFAMVTQGGPAESGSDRHDGQWR